jgi:hypothetical protein
MTRGIFLVGNESALCRAIEAETINRVDQYTAALIPNRLSTGNLVGTGKPAASANDKRLFLDWNPSSPISARTLVLAAENRLERIDEAILVCSPPSIRSSAAEIPLSDIEIMTNDHIKGWLYLVKELAGVFTNRQHGTLILVYPDIGSGKDDAADVLGPAALASFRALTHGLLSSAHNEKYTTVAFSTSDAGNEAAFAAFLYKTIDELAKRSNGKLHKFGKFKLF